MTPLTFMTPRRRSAQNIRLLPRHHYSPVGVRVLCRGEVGDLVGELRSPWLQIVVGARETEN